MKQKALCFSNILEADMYPRHPAESELIPDPRMSFKDDVKGLLLLGVPFMVIFIC
jgi:hypothetical protein